MKLNFMFQMQLFQGNIALFCDSTHLLTADAYQIIFFTTNVSILQGSEAKNVPKDRK